MVINIDLQLATNANDNHLPYKFKNTIMKGMKMMQAATETIAKTIISQILVYNLMDFASNI